MLQVPTILFTTIDGNEQAVEAKVGHSVMNAAVDAGIDGIDADCGGGCACGTCHVHVAREWMDKVGSRGEMEQELLEFAEGYDDCSRLCCQIKVSKELDGLRVRVVER